MVNKLELIPLSPGNVDFARRIRNRYRDNFIDSHEITREEHLAWFARYLDNFWDVTYVIDVGGVSIGTIAICSINTVARTADIARVVVDEDHRRQGIASKAMGLVMDYSKKHLDVDTLHTKVRTTNVPALGLFSKAGFTFNGKVRNGVIYGTKS